MSSLERPIGKLIKGESGVLKLSKNATVKWIFAALAPNLIFIMLMWEPGKLKKSYYHC